MSVSVQVVPVAVECEACSQSSGQVLDRSDSHFPRYRTCKACDGRGTVSVQAFVVVSAAGLPLTNPVTPVVSRGVLGGSWDC